MEEAPAKPKPAAHNRLASLLLEQKEALLRRWEERVLADPEVPEANRLTKPELRDDIPLFLEDLAAKMKMYGAPAAPNESMTGEIAGRKLGADGTATAHAKQRFAQRYATSAALRELSHFRAVVVELCFREAIVLEHDTAQLLHAALDGAMARAATEIERHAHRALREEVAVRERFLAILTHDLRSPINAIYMATQMLLQQEPTDGQASFLRRVARSAQSAERMIEDMLDLAKARLGGGIALNVEHASIRSVCRRAIDEAQLVHPGRVLTFAPHGDSTGQFDPGRLQQIVANLLANAIAYSPAGSRVGIRTHENVPNHVVIEVHNDGRPIPPEEIDLLFEPFKRGKEFATSRRGLGLGLFIARELAVAHRGTLDVASSVEEGTIFTVTLPHHRGESLAE